MTFVIVAIGLGTVLFLLLVIVGIRSRMIFVNPSALSDGQIDATNPTHLWRAGLPPRSSQADWLMPQGDACSILQTALATLERGRGSAAQR